LKREFRLTHQKDFDYLRIQGKTKHHPFMILVYHANELNISRVAVVASRNIGNAVKRNFIRRRLKACIHLVWPDIKHGWDMILYAKPRINDANFDEIEKAVNELLQRAGLFTRE